MREKTMNSAKTATRRNAQSPAHRTHTANQYTRETRQPTKRKHSNAIAATTPGKSKKPEKREKTRKSAKNAKMITHDDDDDGGDDDDNNGVK